MAKLVELYIMDEYQGLHTFSTAKRLVWEARGFCHLDKTWTKERLMKEEDTSVINSAIWTGEITEID